MIIFVSVGVVIKSDSENANQVLAHQGKVDLSCRVGEGVVVAEQNTSACSLFFISNGTRERRENR